MIYLDNAATCCPKQQVLDYTIDVMKMVYANPNSVNYEIGLDARRIIEESRRIVADKINADPEEIFFTSSASASNSLAICGYLNNKNNNCRNFITSNLEHSSVRDIEVNGVYKTIEPCNTSGFLNVEQFSKYKNCLISITACNNEIGTIQPIIEISKVVHSNNNIIHSDLTQYIPYMKINVKELGVDMATFSAHKIHGLKGCGVLYKKKSIELSPIVFGSQEQGLFGGTENVYSIAACGKAIELLNYDNINEIRKMRNHLIEELLKVEGVILNGDIKSRSPGNINLCLNNIYIDNVQLSAILDCYGYCVGIGSSCHAGDNKPSQILLAIGRTEEEARRSIRITINEDNTMEEIDKLINDLKNIIEQFKK